MQTVGELDQCHTQITARGHEELAEVFGLFRLSRMQLEVRQLGDAIDQFGNLTTKPLFHFGVGGFRILNRVVQQGGDDGRIVHLLFGQKHGHSDRMSEIRLPRLAHLPIVHLLTEGISVGKHFSISAGVVGADQPNQIVCCGHSGPTPSSGGPGLSAALELPSMRAEGFLLTCHLQQACRPQHP